MNTSRVVKPEVNAPPKSVKGARELEGATSFATILPAAKVFIPIYPNAGIVCLADRKTGQLLPSENQPDQNQPGSPTA